MVIKITSSNTARIESVIIGSHSSNQQISFVLLIRQSQHEAWLCSQLTVGKVLDMDWCHFNKLYTTLKDLLFQCEIMSNIPNVPICLQEPTTSKSTGVVTTRGHRASCSCWTVPLQTRTWRQRVTSSTRPFSTHSSARCLSSSLLTTRTSLLQGHPTR